MFSGCMTGGLVGRANAHLHPSLKPSEGLKERSLCLHKVQVIEMNV
jgi:hypothetical protein